MNRFMLTVPGSAEGTCAGGNFHLNSMKYLRLSLKVIQVVADKGLGLSKLGYQPRYD